MASLHTTEEIVLGLTVLGCRCFVIISCHCNPLFLVSFFDSFFSL
uniref:Uncharacterized protein n=1 Tax=Arundo donax TaxID=35708 RepID=A0A0A9ETG1_ARUDO